MFDGIKEALHHQKKYGGKIYLMDEVEMEKYWEWDCWNQRGWNTIFFFTNMEVYEVFNIQILIAKLKMVKPTGVRKTLITKYIKRKHNQ